MGAGHQHGADGAEDGEREHLAKVLGGWADDVDGDEQGDEHDAGDEDVEEGAEGVCLDEAVVGGAGRGLELAKAGEEGSEGAEHGEPADGFAGDGSGQDGLDEHDEHAGQGHEDFRQDADEVVHRAPLTETTADPSLRSG